MHQNMPNRGCNLQTSTSPLTRVHRLHRQYTNNQITDFLQACPRTNFRAEGATEAHSEAGDPATGAAWEELAPGETTGTVPRLHVDTVAHGPTEQEKNARPRAKNAAIVGVLDIFQKYVDKIVKRL